MRVISKKKLREYYEKNTQSEKPLTEWYYKMKNATANNLNELRKTFHAGADSVNGYTVFNIGGNHYWLITAMHYKHQRCYIRVIWTHAEYSRKLNQEKLKQGGL